MGVPFLTSAPPGSALADVAMASGGGRGTPASGAGVAIRGDVLRLLASLPDRGEISFRVTPRQGAALDGRYDLVGAAGDARLNQLVREAIGGGVGFDVMKTTAAISPLRICCSATWCGMKVFSMLMPSRLKISGPE